MIILDQLWILDKQKMSARFRCKSRVLRLATRAGTALGLIRLVKLNGTTRYFEFPGSFS